MDNAALFRPITKYSEEVVHAESIPEAITNAFRSATEPNQGAAFCQFATRYRERTKRTSKSDSPTC